jgi:rubrerythrin
VDTEAAGDSGKVQGGNGVEHSLSAVFSNLAKACEKQFKPKEAELFTALADYFEGRIFEPAPLAAPGPEATSGFAALAQAFAEDERDHFTPLKAEATAARDRGALRMATWGSKVNAIQKSIAERYSKKGDELLVGKSLFVCEACGFIYLGDEAPEICPVCKAPAQRFSHVA